MKLPQARLPYVVPTTLAALFLFQGFLTLAFAQVPLADTAEMERRVDSMIGKLSLEQKIDLLGGVDGFYVRDIPSIGLPRLKMSDGPVGVRNELPSTAYAAGTALAASWDPALALRVGKAIGQDARARGVHFLLGPGVNLYRAPMGGRNFEYLGEDPYLAARLVVPYIQGVQSQGVVATVKHYALNNQEFNRHNVSSNADERTMRELYLPAFEAAVKEGPVGAVMNSYNLINGQHATQNDWLNNKVLKGDWGFQGVLISDWDATYDGIAAAKGGLDLEMPSAKFMNRATLLEPVNQGTLPVSVIDDKVRRILRTALQFSFLDRPQLDLTIPTFNRPNSEVALDEARESIVLLKNERQILPLLADQLKTVAVIGPNAWPAVASGGGSSEVTPFHKISILEAVQAQNPNLKVLYTRGLPTRDEIAHHTHFEGGVEVTTYQASGWTGPATVSHSDRIDTLEGDVYSPLPSDGHSVRYKAKYLPSVSGPHYLLLDGSGNDDYTVRVDGKPLIVRKGQEGWTNPPAIVSLQAGVAAAVELDYLPHSARTNIRLGIVASADIVTDEARQLASHADAAIVAIGFNDETEGEGRDRTYTLPPGQDELICAVVERNKKTVVTLNAGGEADSHLWLDKVQALLHLWYPGQEGGTAVAEILFGKRSPEGKLPISYARGWEQNPTHDFYYPTPDKPLEVAYKEGLNLGYRYYLTKHEKPLFPFGFGLSYTTFAFRNLRIQPSANSHEFDVTFVVTNTGSVSGAEVAQLYVGDPSATQPRPALELKAFEKVRLGPGESKQVSIHLDSRSLSYWDQGSHNWKIDPGKFVVQVGNSSEDQALSGSFNVP